MHVLYNSNSHLDKLCTLLLSNLLHFQREEAKLGYIQFLLLHSIESIIFS